ncbi:MAG: transcription termination/antitermination factor NusG [Leptospiraceae bacterium]|nr:transcription termination/antitermination factor NusG [Leptospiraceae bacterium]MCB1199694.1 transcription termination/antitermination factor NusG [Leptospiraceae bacterium]
MGYSWYVINTMSSHEDKVRKLIERSKEKWDDGALIGQVKVPTHEVAELRGGKKRVVRKKLMPGYVFLELDVSDEIIRKIRSIPGVMGFVSTGNDPQVMSDDEMQSLFTEMGEVASEEKSAPRILFSEGETVKIIDGPFANFNGIVDEVNHEKGKVRVKVEIFGRSTPVELDYLQVGKG